MLTHMTWLGLLVGMLTAANASAQDGRTTHPARAAFEQTVLFPRVLTRPVVTEQAIWVGQGGSVPTWKDQLYALCRVDPATRQVTATIPLGAQPIALAVGGGAVWVHQQSTTASLIRIDERTLTPEPIPGVGWNSVPFAFGALIAFGEGSVWVVEHDVVRAGPVILYGRRTSTVVRVDPRTGRVLARIPLPGVAAEIAAGAGAVWVLKDGAVWRIDPATNRIVATITVPGAANDIAVGEGFVWVVGYHPVIIGPQPDSELIRIDPATNRVVGEPTRVPRGYCTLAAGAGAVWVTGSTGVRDDFVVRIDPETGLQIGEPISVPNVQRVAAGRQGVWVSRWERPKGKNHLGLLTPIVP